jgi:hypothetical protein
MPEHIGYRQFFIRDNRAVIVPGNLHRVHPSPDRQRLRVLASLPRDSLADFLVKAL